MISFPTMLLRLGLALALGALVGFEREWRNHEAGIRTNALVALGSCLFTLISAFGFSDLLTLSHTQIDPTRIASYVVAGIGFLGAGSIFLSRGTNRVKGLTTAAAVWLVAAIGMACGAGLLLIAVATTVLALVVLIALHSIERLLLPRQFSHIQHLRLETTSSAGQVLGQVCDALSHIGISVEAIEVRAEQEAAVIIVKCQLPNTALVQVIDQLRVIPGVRSVNANLRSS